MRKRHHVVAAFVAGLFGLALLVSGCSSDTESVSPSRTVSLKQNVLDAYAVFAASDSARLVQLQGKMATPNVYLADMASGRDATGATPAEYWYVRNGLHDDGVSLAPEALLYANLENLRLQEKIADFDFQLILNLGHSDNVNTDEAFAWMDDILSQAGSSSHTPAGETGWWDVTDSTLYPGEGRFAVDDASSGSVTSSSDTGTERMRVTLDGAEFYVTHYWGYYVSDPNSANQKINIYVPENVSAGSPTYFRVNNGGWAAGGFRATVIDGAEYNTGNLAYNTVQSGSANNNDVIAEALNRGMILVSYGTRSRTDAPVDGEYLGHSPAVITDTKAAVRFLKYNMVYGNLPGNPDRIIVTGHSGGGGLTTTLAAGGNSTDYFASLVDIGALGINYAGGNYTNDASVGDSVFATFSSAPIIDLFKADYAYEWMYNPTRQQVANGEYEFAEGVANGRNAPNYLADWQNLGSMVLAQHGYQDYIRDLGLEVNDVQHTLLGMVETALERTLNEDRGYRPELFDVSSVTTASEAKGVLSSILRYGFNDVTPGFESLPLDWFGVTGTAGNFDVEIEDSAWDDFSEYSYWTSQWVKYPPAADGQGLDTELGKLPPFAAGESSLWGHTNEPYNHTNAVSWAMDPANWPLLGLTPSTRVDDAARHAENAELAATLYDS